MSASIDNRVVDHGRSERKGKRRDTVREHVLQDPRVRYTRRKGVIGASVALLALGGGGAYQLAQAFSDTVEVIAIASDVPRGQVIEASDLTVAAVGPHQALTPIPSTQVSEITGRRAAADLTAGSILTPSAVTDTTIPAAGESVVGVAVTPQQLPTAPIIPGDHVRVISTPNPGDNPPKDSPESITATVLSVDHADTGHVIVNVIVESDTGPELAARVATGRVAVVLDSREPGTER